METVETESRKDECIALFQRLVERVMQDDSLAQHAIEAIFSKEWEDDEGAERAVACVMEENRRLKTEALGALHQLICSMD